MSEDNRDLIKALQKGLGIDKNNLDEEFTRAPEMFHRVADLYSRAQLDHASVKVDIENAESDLYILFRKKAQEEMESIAAAGEKPEKVTDTAINRKVNASKKVRALQKALMEASERVSRLGALKESYQQRGYALNNLTTLYTSNYWQKESGGKLRSEIKEELADRGRHATGKLRRERRGE